MSTTASAVQEARTGPSTRSSSNARCRTRRSTISVWRAELEEKGAARAGARRIPPGVSEYDPSESHRGGQGGGARAEDSRAGRSGAAEAAHRAAARSRRRGSRTAAASESGLARAAEGHVQAGGARDILTSSGAAPGSTSPTISRRSRPSAVYTVKLEGVTLEQALQPDPDREPAVLQSRQPAHHHCHPGHSREARAVRGARHQDVLPLARRGDRAGADAQSDRRECRSGVQPMVMPNKTANTITIRTTAALAGIIERVIRANDRPRAEILRRHRDPRGQPQPRQAVRPEPESVPSGLFFSPEQPPSVGQGCCQRRRPFNLNTISQGVSTADFYLAVPTAIVRFLETDSPDAASLRSRSCGAPKARS